MCKNIILKQLYDEVQKLINNIYFIIIIELKSRMAKVNMISKKL